MNKDQIEGSWTELQGKIKQQWAKLTDDDLTLIEGKREELAGCVQKRYGKAKEAAEDEVREFIKRSRPQ